MEVRESIDSYWSYLWEEESSQTEEKRSQEDSSAPCSQMLFTIQNNRSLLDRSAQNTCGTGAGFEGTCSFGQMGNQDLQKRFF